MQIKFCQPYDKEEAYKRIKPVIESGWWTSGKYVEEFEKKFAEYTGAKYCVAVNSCTSAIFLSLKYLQHKNPNIKRVYVPSFTFASTVNEVVQARLKPVFGDVDIYGLLKAENLYGDVALPVHFAGRVADTDYPVPVIEDSAHRVERDQCKDNKNLVCFSFYATKNIAMGEGGAICTNDKEAYEWFKLARSHGITKDGFQRYNGDWEYDMEFIGWKFNLSDIHAAIGLGQLEKIDEINKKRNEILESYNAGLDYSNSGNHLYNILVGNREEFIKWMGYMGIQTSVHFKPVHLMKAYKDFNKSILPMTEFLWEHTVSIPFYPSLNQKEIEYIINKTKEYGDIYR